jgi:hypothetical protein
LDLRISRLELDQHEIQKTLASGMHQREKALKDQAQLKTNISNASSRYNFFQEMMTRVNSLSALQKEKVNACACKG